MMSGDRLGLKFPDICLMGEENPQKNLTQETCPDRESNPLRERRICYPLLHNDEETGAWRRLHNTELRDLYGKPDIIRTIESHRLRWAGHVARMGDERGVRRILEGKPEGKRPVGRPRMKWENNINHDLGEVDYTGDDWKTLAQDRDVWRAYVYTAMNLRVR
ncbi:hypothetical protein C0J52_07979 [Blattella germanica]|nr:hypothetical protein C0J52_07979 [Blattella germanica]